MKLPPKVFRVKVFRVPGRPPARCARPTRAAVAAAVAIPTALSVTPAASAASAAAGVRGPTTASSAAAGTASALVAQRDWLRLGDDDLPESRTTRALAAGVTHTVITRGEGAATASRINVTSRGPWRINVVTIDPRRSRHTLETAFGNTLMAPEATSRIAARAGAKVAMNGSFFNYQGPTAFRGDPVGLTVTAGTVMSEQTGSTAEQNVFIDADRGRLRMGRFTWKGYVRNTATDKGRTLAGVNRVPRVPAPCASGDTEACAAATGELVRFSPRFAASTPSGPGAEAVYGPDGCLVRVSPTRGTKLSSAQFSVQGTGARAAQLLREADDGCVRLDEYVLDGNGDRMRLRSDTYGLSGRYRLVRDGDIVRNTGSATLFGRHPRSIIGRTADGRIELVTIDGRSVSSVGATLVEAAQVARGLGLVDAVNLDGGGSTTLAVDGAVVNRVSGASERPVSDALVLVR